MRDDFNCQLQRNVPGCTGKWCMTTKPDGDHGEEMLDLIRLHDLFAVDTLFKPAKKRWGTERRSRLCNATHLQKDVTRRPTKLDYICVTNRWKSMMESVTVRWGPSEHRFGNKNDHGFLSVIWHWKTRRPENFRTEDYAVMNDQSWRRFDDRLQMKLEENIGKRGENLSTSVTTSEEVTAQDSAGQRRCGNGTAISQRT